MVTVKLILSLLRPLALFWSCFCPCVSRASTSCLSFHLLFFWSTFQPLSRLNPSVQLERTCSEFVPLSWRSWSQFDPLWLLQWLNLIFTMLIISYVHLWTYSVCLCVISLCHRSWLNCYKRFLVCVGSQSPGSWEKAAGGLLLFPRMFASHPEVFFSSKESRVFNSCVRWSEGLWININHVSGHMSQSVKQGF